MPISPLPGGTVRRLGPSLVITSPVALLKELLDNAIDSGATSIEVLVSPNTVDRVEVRDNGHGINPDDLDSLGRPGHTSKLRSFDELSGLGGSSLGFRGSALASANALGEVSLTTRVSTERVATVISLAKGGGIGTQRHASAPVGTSICVTAIFSRLPVRAQVAVKEAPKNLTKMKQLLLSHALTRPWIRLRFTVLKTPNLAWSYAPTQNGGVKEAAMQLFGTELASQCIFETFPNAAGSGQTSTSRSDLDSSDKEGVVGPVFEALLPIPGADLRKLVKGVYLSVDSRPVSPTLGTSRKLLSTFRKRLGDHFARGHSQNLPRDPFIRLNIRCPPGSYDVNVEPSKDDVLFSDEQLVLGRFESFLSSIYFTSEPCDLLQPSSISRATTDGKVPNVIHTTAPFPGPPPQPTPWRVDMSSGLNGLSDDGNDGNETPPVDRRQRTEEDMLPTTDGEMEEGDREPISKYGLNPWSIAKLTGAPRPLGPTVSEAVSEIQGEARLSLSADSVSANNKAMSLPTRPERSLTLNLGPRPPNQSRAENFVNPASSGRPLQHVLGRGFQRPTVSSARSSTRQGRPRRNRGLQSPSTSSPQEQGYDASVPRGRFGQAHREESGREVQSRISFGRHRTRQQPHAGDDFELDQQSPQPRNRSRRMRDLAVARRLEREVGENLASAPLTLDFRHERTLLQPPPPRQSGIQQRGTPEAVAATTDISGKDILNGGTPEVNLPAEDPRVRLMRQQRSITQQEKPKRLKTEHLPLEVIPSGFQTRALLLTMAADPSRLAQILPGVSQFDTYLVDGKLRGAFKGGAGSEISTSFVESFLATMGHEAAVTV